MYLNKNKKYKDEFIPVIDMIEAVYMVEYWNIFFKFKETIMTEVKYLDFILYL